VRFIRFSGYKDKFGEDRLIEASVCVERIISQKRWSAKSVRIEGTLSHIRDHRLVPILLDSVNSLHAYSQLLNICQKLTSPESAWKKNLNGINIKGVKLSYYNSITNFYKVEKVKITDIRAQEMIFSHYKIEK
jgi:hypothetical protein